MTYLQTIVFLSAYQVIQIFGCQHCLSGCVSNSCTGSCEMNYYKESRFDGTMDNPIYFACTLCVGPCESCLMPSYCITCNSPIHTAQSGVCECMDGYVANITGGCEPCTAPCRICSTSDTYCTACIDPNSTPTSGVCYCHYGYYQDGAGCSQCLFPCATCDFNESFCLSCRIGDMTAMGGICSCAIGSYLNGTTCRNCASPCATCVNSNSNCLSCVYANQSVQSGLCVCDDGYFGNPIVCSQCISPCLTCNGSASYCQSCQYLHQTAIGGICTCDNGYYGVPGNICAQCVSPCSTCIGDANHCLSCDIPSLMVNATHQCVCSVGYIQVGQACEQCIVPCATCSGLVNQCLTCVDTTMMHNVLEHTCSCPTGSYFNLTRCVQCIRPCATCTGTGTQCDSCFGPNIIHTGTSCICQDGYVLQSGQCVACIPPCQNCSGNPTNCESCIGINLQLVNHQCGCLTGQFLQGNQCLDCNSPCNVCAYGSGQCMNCIPGYYLQGNECQPCLYPCRTCDHLTICTSCVTQYALNYQLGQVTCESCLSIEVRSVEACQYSNCTDLVWTWGEQCDDGNNIDRDGCTNCMIDPNYSCTNRIMTPSQCFACLPNCHDCDPNLYEVACNVCDLGYFLNQSQCVQCDNACLGCVGTPNQCISCRFNTGTQQCRMCEVLPGQFSDFNGQSCYSICGDGLLASIEECDDGNNLNGDGCSDECKVESGYICEPDQDCYLISYPIPTLKATTTDIDIYNNLRQFQLTFNQPLIGISSNITTSLMEIIDSSVNYSLTNQVMISQLEENQINLVIIFDLELNSSCIDQQITIKFIDPSLFINYLGYELQNNSVSTGIPNFQFVSDKQKATTESVMNTNEYMLYVLLILIGVSILCGGLDVFYNLLDMLQQISYLKYFNTQFPYNLSTFFELFEFAQIKFQNEYISFESLGLLDIQYENPPPKIEQDGYNSLILSNIVSLLQVWIFFLITYFMAKLILILLLKPRININPLDSSFIMHIKGIILMIKQYITKSCLSIRDSFIYSGFYRIHISTAFDYSFSVILNLYIIDLTSDNNITLISSVITIVMLFIYFWIIFRAISALNLNKYELQQTRTQLRHGTLYEGLKSTRIGKYYTTFILIKKILFMFTLIMMYQEPIYQCINIILLSVMQLLFYILADPIKEFSEYIKQLSCEACMLITELTICVFIADDTMNLLDVDIRDILGWICISSISLIIAIQIIVDIVQQWRAIYKQSKTIRNLIDKLRFKKHTDNFQQQNGLEEIIL